MTICIFPVVQPQWDRGTTPNEPVVAVCSPPSRCFTIENTLVGRSVEGEPPVTLALGTGREHSRKYPNKSTIVILNGPETPSRDRDAAVVTEIGFPVSRGSCLRRRSTTVRVSAGRQFYATLYGSFGATSRSVPGPQMGFIMRNQTSERSVAVANHGMWVLYGAKSCSHRVKRLPRMRRLSPLGRHSNAITGAGTIENSPRILFRDGEHMLLHVTKKFSSVESGTL